MADTFLLIGMPMEIPNGVGTPQNVALNASTVSLAYFFESKTSDPITWLGVRRSSVTGTPPTYRISLQGVDSSGNPDGVIKSSGNAFATFTGASLTNAALNRITLGASYTPTIGEILCYVIEYSSGTIDASNLLTVTASSVATTALSSKFPTWASGASGVYTKAVIAPMLAYGTAGATYGFPLNSVLTQNINSGATAEAAAKFSCFAGLSGTYRVRGVRFTGGTSIVAKSVTLSLYAGGGATDTTAAVTATRDTDLFPTAAGRTELMFDPGTYPVLTMGSTYRVGLSTPDASNQQLLGISVSNTGDMSAFDYGDNFTLSTRASGGNWTDTPNSRLLLELIVDDVSPAAGGGGAPPAAKIFGVEMGPALSQ